MHLKSIELSGFKSFAKRSELEFTSPISAIVGPNGSGKSNLAEAFRFVLGEQSMKSMRGKRGEDLIFNGTPEVPRANRASAKVVFDNSDKFLSIDFPEVSVERVVHRDGVNEYLVNGSQVRLRDVIELLASAHIGASGHHIISQGEADRILNSSPRERKAMIEDALGLKIYQYKKEESIRKLEKTEENIREVEALRREIAPHLRFLKKQVEKAERVAELRGSLSSLCKEYLFREEKYIERERRSIEERSAPLRERQAKLEGELANARAVLESSAGRDARSDKVLELQTMIKETRNQKDALVRDLGRIEGEVASLERLLERERRAGEQNETKTVLLRDVESLASGLRQRIDDIAASVDMERIRDGLRWILGELDGFIATKRESSSPERIGELEAEIARLKTEDAELHTKIHDIRNVEQGHSLEYELLKMEIEKEKDSSRDAEKEVFRIQAMQNELNGEMQSLRSSEERLRLITEEFNREREEGAVLIGRDVLTYREARPSHDGRELSDEEVVSEDRHAQEERRRELEKLKIRIEESGTSGLEETVKEYEETAERDRFLERELGDLVASAVTLRNLIVELEGKLSDEFKAGVERINRQFSEYFALMFGGGTAGLRVVAERKRRRPDADLMGEVGGAAEPEEEEDEEEGIEVDVSLPRKKVRSLMMLSGGERALTSIALLFAVSLVNPPPFIILDETDAALDEANSRKYGDMLENLSKHSQLIVITHNRETMSRAGVLYGVTMGRGGASALLSIKFEEGVEYAK